MDEATTKQNEQPRGKGRDVIKLVQEDMLVLPVIQPEHGLETIYLWARSTAVYLKERINGDGIMPNVGRVIIADLEARAQLGEVKYGERLRAFNGRNAPVDAYQEALDLVNYLRQVFEESEIKK
jgi:hypothetical protein